MVKLDKICREANVMLVLARSYGLTGFVRICVKVRFIVVECFVTCHGMSAN